MTDLSTPPAVDLSPQVLAPRLSAYLASTWGRPVVLDAWRRYPAGMSWITIGFIARLPAQGGDPEETRDLILRIGDPTGLLAPYRAEPEALVLTALGGIAGLPVPPVYASSDDYGVIGAPFLVTGRIEGDTPMPWKGAAAARGEAQNISLGNDFVDALAAIHTFDWHATPLVALWRDATPQDVARAQVRTWSRHAGLGTPAHGAAWPLMHYAMRWLEHRAPVAEQVTIVHGDYRVGNFLQKDGRITAILDWELMHAGDPHEDIAWAGLRTFSAGTTRIGGLIEREDFYKRYAQRTGFTVRPEVVRYYEVLVQFKMAALLVGAMHRVAGGAAQDVRMAAMGFQLAPALLELDRLIGEAA